MTYGYVRPERVNKWPNSMKIYDDDVVYRFGVNTAVIVKNGAFWAVTSCGLVWKRFNISN